MAIPRRLFDVLSQERALLTVSTLLFVTTWAITITWCGSMSTGGDMAMPGGWSMSMAWMRMPGQSWIGAATSFLGMWTVMMVAMMLPSLVPMLMRYRDALHHPRAAQADKLTAVVGLGYFVAWSAVGIAIFPLGVALAVLAMQHPMLARLVPLCAGVVVLAAGLQQMSRWKERQLTCCAHVPKRVLATDAITALRYGLHLGVVCSRCCAGLIAVLLVMGVMDLRAMAWVAAAISLERLAPAGERIAKGIGAMLSGAGFFLAASSLVQFLPA